MPRVSVITGVFNGELHHVADAINSILSQTFIDFEYIIIDDGSCDEISNLLMNYSRIDSRIRLLRNTKNIGLTRSLNIGLNAAVGEYVARMDADDVCYPTRIGIQVNFLDNNPAIALVGACFDELVAGTVIPQRLPFVSGSDTLRSRLFYFNSFCHSTIMARRELLIGLGGYDESYRHAQDYDLWLRLADRYPVENLNISLLLRRMENGISVKLEQNQRRYAIRARFNAIRRNGYQLKHVWPLFRSVVAYLIGKRGQAIYRNMMGRNT